MRDGSPDPDARLVSDASGDHLDAALCLMQAAWGHAQHALGHAQYGLPEFDPLEGWIVGVVEPTSRS